MSSAPGSLVGSKSGSSCAWRAVLVGLWEPIDVTHASCLECRSEPVHPPSAHNSSTFSTRLVSSEQRMVDMLGTTFHPRRLMRRGHGFRESRFQHRPPRKTLARFDPILSLEQRAVSKPTLSDPINTRRVSVVGLKYRFEQPYRPLLQGHRRDFSSPWAWLSVL